MMVLNKSYLFENMKRNKYKHILIVSLGIDFLFLFIYLFFYHLSLVYFNKCQCNAFQIQPYCWKWQNFILFMTNIPDFLMPLL